MNEAIQLTVGEPAAAVYAAEGLVRPELQLGPDVLGRLRAVAEATTAATPDAIPETLVCTHAPGWNGLPDAITREWLALAGLPEVLALVEAFIGPDILLWGTQYLCKPAGTGLEVAWHQDGAYWPIHPLNTCTVWIAIDDVTTENGCMRYIPGSHRAGRLYPHLEDRRDGLVLNQVVDPQFYDEGTAKDAELRAGELSIHDVFLIHGSRPNRSGKRRAAYILRFMAAASHFDRSENRENASAHYRPGFATRPLYLMRGQAGGNTERVHEHPAYRP